ncbi:MAG: LptF/LptG family permease [Candidatus Marinimicrobia bacterium]|nr:LptF/LptG family permease [Candidatus Neomarinimicrobiota bacterium]
MLKKLDIYLLRQFISILILSLMGFLCVFVIVDLIENLDRYIDNKMPWGIVLKYYGYSLPYFINIALPMSMMIASVFSIGLMAKRNEWTAMKSGGISLYRLTAPLLLFSIAISLVSFQFDNTYVSWGMSMRGEIEKEYMKKKPRRRSKKTLKDIFMQKQEYQHIAITKYQSHSRKAVGITMITFADSLIQQRMDAKNMTWIDTLESWAIFDYSLRSFDENGIENSVMISERDTLLNLDFIPDDIMKGNKHPDELNFKELKARIKYLQSNGVDATRWRVQRHFKVAFAFTNLIVVLFGIPLVVMKPKSGLAFGGGVSFLVIFSYYAFIKFGQSLGINGVMDPMLSAWLGNIVFISGGLLLLFSVRK